MKTTVIIFITFVCCCNFVSGGPTSKITHHENQDQNCEENCIKNYDELKNSFRNASMKNIEQNVHCKHFSNGELKDICILAFAKLTQSFLEKPSKQACLELEYCKSTRTQLEETNSFSVDFCNACLKGAKHTNMHNGTNICFDMNERETEICENIISQVSNFWDDINEGKTPEQVCEIPCEDVMLTR